MDLNVKTREMDGKKPRALRREGRLPAELYGHGIKNLHLEVAVKDFEKVLKAAGMTTIITLLLDTQKHSALIHDVTRGSVSGDVEHIDFYEVRMDEKLKAHIPLEFIGEAPAVKAFGASVNKAMSEIEVEALPSNLPHSLTVDLSMLDELNKSIYVRDIIIPKGVEVLVDLETAIATATPMAEEEVVETPVSVADVKVESDEKKAERAAAKDTVEKSEK